MAGHMTVRRDKDSLMVPREGHSASSVKVVVAVAGHSTRSWFVKGDGFGLPHRRAVVVADFSARAGDTVRGFCGYGVGR